MRDMLGRNFDTRTRLAGDATSTSVDALSSVAVLEPTATASALASVNDMATQPPVVRASDWIHSVRQPRAASQGVRNRSRNVRWRHRFLAHRHHHRPRCRDGQLMDRRAVFFVGAAIVCAMLIPVTEQQQRWVPTMLVIVYFVLAVASWADKRTRARGREREALI